ncbi:MAG: class I SAM-dependent rRNA methyltransferase [Candidatus Dadabacteria bacterium]|nr:MAG: class I SAM-dependent rRNA methyltransferase [Candidatus Dadabacteria bacterium]
MTAPLRLKLKKSLRSAIEAGHPWIYAGALQALPVAEPGMACQIFDRQGFVASGIYEPDANIAVRVWSTNEAERPDDVSVIEARLRRAAALRARVVPRDVEAFRLVHGEADRLPGWQIDRYQDVLVVRTDGLAAEARLPLLVDAVRRAAPAVRALVHRRNRRRGGTAEICFGAIDEALVCREHHWQMEADVLQGQKTGWFIDQRENRRRVFELARGQRVVNVFCYTGGFSLAAALGGAREVTSVDISGPAIAAAQRNFALNGLDPAEWTFVTADAFDWLTERAPDTADLVIIDPPSFAPNRQALPKAIRAYRRLFTAGLQMLSPNGLLAAASCSSHIDDSQFARIVHEAASQAGTQIQILERAGAGPDHPVLPAFPEGSYLKFLVCARLD